MSTIRFGYTIAYVPDVRATLDFFTRAFGFDQGFVSDDGGYGELQSGETTLAFASEAMGEAHFKHGYLRHSMANPPFGTEIVMVTADVATTLDAALDAGAHLLESAQVMPWGQTVAYVRDPNGILIEICTPIG